MSKEEAISWMCLFCVCFVVMLTAYVQERIERTKEIEELNESHEATRERLSRLGRVWHRLPGRDV